MARQQSEPSPSTTSPRTDLSAIWIERMMVLLSGGYIRGWHVRWETFLAAHAEWWARTPQAKPVYWLPKPVVDQLEHEVEGTGREHPGRPAPLTCAEAAAENAFRECCRSFSPSVVGVWDGCPVSYDPLVASSPITISEKQWRWLGWDAVGSYQRMSAALEAVQGKAEVVRHEQLAFAGWLTFNRSYQKEKKDLATRCANLGLSLLLPLLVNPADQAPSPAVASCEPLPAREAAFLEEFTEFRRKWYLNRLVTWDLPLPRGPLEQLPLGLKCFILGPDAIDSSDYPSYFDPPSSWHVREDIREQQKAAGKQAGIDAEFPLTDLSARGGNHASAWENAFRLWFIEQAALQRYQDRARLISRLTEAFMEVLGCSLERAKRLRKYYAGRKAQESGRRSP
jgi:hypothetical protein